MKKILVFVFLGTLLPAAYLGAATIGDVNNDGYITVVDALMVAQYAAGLPATVDTTAADVNCDAAINVIDALFIAKYVSGLVDNFCPGTNSPTPTPASTEPGNAFVHVKGANLVTGNDDTPLYLRGVAFGNEVWSNNNISTTDHSEIDFQRVKEMNMNTIRFYLNYHIFEDDTNPYTYKQTGWDWLDQNVSWAKKYGIYLNLNIHIPQGGFQSEGDGLALWDIPENQNRLIALWKAIATRYAQEPAIGGYDLLNEPYVTVGVEQWQSLAQRLVDEIRTVDTNHLLVVEQLAAVANNWSITSDPAYCQFLVNDAYKNVMYDFHFYEPMDYTYQNAFWLTTFGEAGTYPDETKLIPPADITWANSIYSNPLVSTGTSNWTYYEGARYKVTDPSYIIAKPTMIVQQVGSGTVYFDTTRQGSLCALSMRMISNQRVLSGSGVKMAPVRVVSKARPITKVRAHCMSLALLVMLSAI